MYTDLRFAQKYDWTTTNPDGLIQGMPPKALPLGEQFSALSLGALYEARRKSAQLDIEKAHQVSLHDTLVLQGLRFSFLGQEKGYTDIAPAAISESPYTDLRPIIFTLLRIVRQYWYEGTQTPRPHEEEVSDVFSVLSVAVITNARETARVKQDEQKWNPFMRYCGHLILQTGEAIDKNPDHPNWRNQVCISLNG